MLAVAFIIFIPMLMEAWRCGAAGRHISDAANRLSRGVSLDARRRSSARRAAAVGPARARDTVRCRKSAEMVGDCDARSGLDVPRHRRSGRAAHRKRTL